MSKPLFWLLVSDQDKPIGRKLYREPVVWAYFIGSSVWGFLCETIIIQIPLHIDFDSDPVFIVVAKLIVMVSAFAFPTVVLTARAVSKAEQSFARGLLVVSIFVGLFGTFFLGLGLWLILSISGIHSFFGVPVEKWK
jgi:hypothetical protein